MKGKNIEDLHESFQTVPAFPHDLAAYPFFVGTVALSHKCLSGYSES